MNLLKNSKKLPKSVNQHRQEIKHLIFVGILSVIPRIPCLFGGFVFDDRPAILDNQDVVKNNFDSIWNTIFLHDFWGGNLTAKSSHKSYRPLTTLTFHCNASVFGMSSTSFHLINNLIHTMNCLLVYTVVKKLEKSWTTAFLSASLFSVHPVLTEAICGIVGRADLLWSFFALIAMNFALCKPNWMVVLLTCLSVLAKEQGVMIIPMIMSIQLMKKPKLIKSSIMIYCPLLALILFLRLKIVNFSTPVFQEGDNPAGFLESWFLRVLNFNYVLALNFWLMILPEWLCYDWAMGCIDLIHSIQDFRVMFIGIFWIMMSAIAFRNIRSSLLVFLTIPFIPSSNLFILVGFVIAERNLYMSTLGYSILISKGVRFFMKQRPTITKIMFLYILLISSLRSILRGLEWGTEETLFKSGLRVCPKNAKVHYNIAKLSNDSDIAIEHYTRALDLWPSYEHAMNNLGNIYKNIGEFEQAEILFLKAINISPKFAACWMNLGIVQANLKKFHNAEQSYLEALNLKNGVYPDCLFNLGTLYLKLKQFEKAIQAFENVVEQRPEHFSAHSNLVILLDEVEYYDTAQTKALEALEIFGETKPDFYFHLANIYGKTGKFQQAEQYYLHAIKLGTRNPLYFVNFGVLYHRWKKYDQAKKYYEEALRIDPNHKSAKINLKSLS